MIHRPAWLALVGLLAPGAALAFAPIAPHLPGAAELDEAIGPPSRIHVDHAPAQRRLSAESLAWQRFQAEHPRWAVRWDEATGTPLRLMGDGIDLGPVDRDDDALRASLDLLDELRDLVGVDLRELRLVANAVRGEQRFVIFQRQVLGIPVEGALVQLRFKQGRLVMMGMESHPGARAVVTRPGLSAEDALAEALALIEGDAEVVDPGALTILPIDGPEGLDYALTWRSRVDTGGPLPAQWHTFVDATTGAVLHRYNDVRYVQRGRITGGHEERTVGDPVIIAPLYNVNVSSSRLRATTTDRTGDFSLTGRSAATLSTELKGDFVWVRNSAGADPATSFSAADGGGNDLSWGYGDLAPMSATHTYHNTHVVRDRALSITPDLDVLQRRMMANVEIASSCNAFYNGLSINFFQESADCNNTGRIADVVFHEYGHHYHSSLVVSGRVDGAIGEGSGDYLAATITNDPEMAPGFNRDGSAIRNISPDRIYPDDLVGEVHSDGLIWAGAMWDLRTHLITTLGPVEGVRRADHLFATALMGGPTLSTAYEEMLIADDDDGDLSNGTPNRCLISEEFGRHGLGPGVRAVFTHSDRPQVASGEPLAISVDIATTFAECLELDAATAVVKWSTRPDGPFVSAPLTSADGQTFTGAIPAQAAGTLLYYTFQIDDTEGEPHSANGDRSFALYQTWFGELTQLACDDFEADDGGYTHELRAGEFSEGADDWMWGSPRGASGDPPAAASGSRIWGNDLAPEGFNGAYQANKVNALISAPYSTAGSSGVLLRYRRWLSVEDGAYDQATIYLNDEVIWQNEALPSGRGNTEDRRWTWHYVPLNGKGDDLDALTLTFELSTDEGLELGGWNIDDVCLFAAD